MPESAKKTVVRSRECGLKDIHVALLTQNDAGGYTAEKPVKNCKSN